MHRRIDHLREICLVLLMLLATASLLSAKEKTPAELTSAINSRLAQIQALGEPVTLAELNKWYEEPPAGKNAADIYREAFATLTEGEPTNAAYVAKNQKAIGLLLQAVERRQCRYPLDLNEGYKVLLPHLAQIRRSANLLATAAAQEATMGRMDAATKLLEADFRVSQSLEREPMLISRLVAVSSMNIGFQGMEKALSTRAFTEPQLSQLQQSFSQADALVSFHRVLVGERTMCLSMFLASPEEMKKMIPDMPAKSFAYETYQKTPAFLKDKLFMLDTFSNSIARSDQEPPDVPAAMPEIPDDCIYSRMLLPATPQALNKAVEFSARLRIARTVIAIERYRLSHGNALPGTLADLPTALLTSVPVDPFDQKPLRYKKLAHGYVVYSVGKNKIDDGGINPPGTRASNPPDLTFTVTR